MQDSSVETDGSRLTSAQRARIGVSGYFVLFGICSGTWASHIPFAKTELQSGPAAFGVALLCMGLGAILSMPTVSWFISQYGSAAVCRTTAIGMSLTLLLPFLAPNVVTLALGLLIFGGCAGALDVAVNAHGLIVERRLAKPVMSSFHGLWGAAALVGALAATLLIGSIPEYGRAIGVCSACILALPFLHSLMLSAEEDKSNSSPSFALPNKKTFILGLLALLAMMNEGAVADWAGIFLRDYRATSPQVTTLAFAAFAGSLAFSRMIADGLRGKWGSAALTGVSASLAAIALATAVLVKSVPMAVISFGLAGFFIGPLAPIFYAGGGRVDEQNPSRGIGAVVTMGYIGNLFGPPIVGFIAEIINLAAALGLMAAGAAMIALLSKHAAHADGRVG